MAKMNSDFSLSGRLGNISIYKMKGVDKPVARTPGGPTKKQIKTAPQFESTRRINAEFGGRSASSSAIMKAIFPLKALADYNIAGPLNALIKPIQAMDTENEHGKRNVYLSRVPGLLEGFSFNKENRFDTIIRNPISYTLSKEERSATVSFPAMVPGINFHAPKFPKPYFSFIVALGVVPDFVLDNKSYGALDKIRSFSNFSMSEWYPVLRGSAAVDLSVNFPPKIFAPASENFSLLLSVGIRFGEPGYNGEIQQVKYAGAGKIMATG
jgi:hypothetical protein